MGVHVVNKIFSVILALISVVLLVTCVWTLASLLVQEPSNQNPPIPANCSESSTDALCHQQSSPPSEESKADVHENHETDSIVASPDNTKWFLWAEFSGMNSTFRLVILICMAFVIGLSLIQLLCSFLLICSPAIKVASRSRTVVGILFFVFVLLLACFAVPLALKRDVDSQDQLHTMTTLNSVIGEFFHDFGAQNIFKDLTLYYIELLCNVLYLFLYMVLTCCLLRCSGNGEFEIYS